ncbi:hypothetical protein IWW36_005452, partial [Coemansia brasiliensis]
SCGFAVPLMNFKSERETLIKHHASKTNEARAKSRIKDNSVSIDGIPSFLEGTDFTSALAKRRITTIMDMMLPWAGGAALGAALAIAAFRGAFKWLPA